MKVVVYLDDRIGTAGNREIASITSDCIKGALVKADFVINFGKVHWDPSNKARWLVFFC